MSVQLVSYNIQYGLGKDGRYDLERIAAAVADADIIALQEVERFWQRSGMVDQPAEIARRLPDFHWIYGANLDMDASKTDDEGRPTHRRRQFGNMLLSRLPIISSRNHLLPKFGAVNQHTMQRGALETVIDLPGIGATRVYSTHLCHLTAGTRLPQVDHVLDLHRKVVAEGGAWSGGHPDPAAGWTEGVMPPMPERAIVMGDFNFEPTDPEYEKFVGPWSDEYGRVIPLAGFVDSWVAAGHGEQEGITCDGKRIDYAFISSSLKGLAKKAWVDSNAAGSDHQPYWCEIG
jgi:endonuclease/exonuclease/phosphatase family metal-dependent hydrolase